MKKNEKDEGANFDNPIQSLLDAARGLGLDGQVQVGWRQGPDGARIVAVTLLAASVESESGEGWHWDMWDPPTQH